jgi:hypothetical protein
LRRQKAIRSKVGQHLPGAGPAGGLLDGDIAPAEDRQPLVGGEIGDLGDSKGPFLRSDGEKGQAGGVTARLGQREPSDLAEERVGQLREDSGTVTGVRVRAGRAAVLQVTKNAQGTGHHIVAAPRGQVCDKPDAAGVVLETAVVKSVRCGRHHQYSCRQISAVMRSAGGRRWPCCYT